MEKDFDVLNKALENVRKSQSNFINGDGKDNQDSIHSNPLNNENGSISRTQGATGDGNDPVNSSNLEHKNPEGQSGNGVHAEGTKTTKTGNATQDHDAVSTSPDDTTQYDKEAKSQTHKGSYDRTGKDKNGVREVHNPVHNSTRNLGDKPNANANAENHIAEEASGTKHNDADLAASIKKLINVSKSLANAVNVNCGAINALKSEYNNGIQNLNARINKTAKAINAPKTVNNTIDKSTEANQLAQNGRALHKHMNPANVRGMFYHAEHSKGKKHTKEMADADNAVTRCHNSHKSLTDDQWGAIEAKAYMQAAKNINDAAKSLDSKLVHDAQTGNKRALGKDNYEYDQSEKAKQAHKSVNQGSAATATNSAATKSLSLADCMSMMASAKKAGNDKLVSKCSSMCEAMKSGKAAKSEMANIAKNVSSVDHDSKANTSNIRANSAQKPNSKSDDIDHSAKSLASNATKSMPHGKALNANPKTTVNKSVHNNNVIKSMPLTPAQIRVRAKTYARHFQANRTNINKSVVDKATDIAKKATSINDLNKSLNLFNQR